MPQRTRPCPPACDADRTPTRSMSAAPPPRASDVEWMRAALEEARSAASSDDVPVGAIIVHDGVIVARAANRTVRDQDPTAHAELLAIRAASAALGSWRLDRCTLYV